MNLADAIPPDDLLLARLVTSKLASVAHGILSVGVAALELDSPADFLTGKDRVILGFLEVLRCIGVRPGHADKIELLREPVNQLAEQVVEFHSSFLDLARWRTMPSAAILETAERLAVLYTDFLGSLAAFSALLGLDSDFTGRAQQGRNRVDEFLRTLDRNATPMTTLP
jgi:hypothetical protein